MQGTKGLPQAKPSRFRSGSVKARGGRPSKTKLQKQSRPKVEKRPPKVRGRERLILEAVADVVNKKRPSPTKHGWPGENWKKGGWGPDKLRPPPGGRDPVVQVKKSESIPEEPKSQRHGRARTGDVKYIRKVQGVLSPLDSHVLKEVYPLTEHRPIATLAHKLDRVLFNPGVHWLQEPRSGVYNFTPWLQQIPDVNDFAFERLPLFVKSSRDEDLWELAKQEKKLFGGSTSSLTGMLSQVYFLISGIRPPDTSSLSQAFQYMSGDFTPGQRMPASVLLNYKEGVYAVDSAHNEGDDPEKNVLIWLGTLLEKFLTMPPEEFRRLLRDSPNPVTDSGKVREAYRYAKSRKFVMRSQLDCHDSRLPGTGVFDLKTRAVLPTRLDLMNYKQHSTYLIRTIQGEMESFEREYHDLMRSAFLKYSFQARIGNMDGVLVAHHNTARIFGFRYIPLTEMDACLFGGGRGEAVFEKCVLLLEEILMEVIQTFPDQTIRCLFETVGDKLEVFVQPEAHDESKGPRPIAHIVVESTSYIDGDRTNSERAVAMSGSWDLRWTIGHTSLSQKEKEDKLGKAKERQLRAYSLPPGVSVEEMEDVWMQLDFGGKQRQGSEGTSDASHEGKGYTPPSPPDLPLEDKESKFDPKNFAPPGKAIMLLRELSMKGKVDMELMLEKAKGQPKLIWGEPEAYVELDEMSGEVVERGETAGEPVVVGGESTPIDEDIRVNEAVASWADYGQVEGERRL